MMRRSLVIASVLGVMAFATAVKADDKANPTGTWKWSVTFNNQTRENTLKLKLDGGKLTGALVGRNRETAITDATFKDGEVSFKVTRERNNQKFTSTYKGKVEGDTIKGKIEFERDGKPESRDWEAKRAKD